MEAVIPTLALFNMRVFKIHIPITRGGKIFPHTCPLQVLSMGIREAGFFDIPNRESLSLASLIEVSYDKRT